MKSVGMIGGMSEFQTFLRRGSVQARMATEFDWNDPHIAIGEYDRMTGWQQTGWIVRDLDGLLRFMSAESFGRMYLIPGNELPEKPEMLHCATCQCARMHGTVPVPGNANSKSWHGAAPTTIPR